jgi:hypothetical protein
MAAVSRYSANDVEDLRKLSLSLAYDQDQRIAMSGGAYGVCLLVQTLILAYHSSYL